LVFSVRPKFVSGLIVNISDTDGECAAAGAKQRAVRLAVGISVVRTATVAGYVTLRVQASDAAAELTVAIPGPVEPSRPRVLFVERVETGYVVGFRESETHLSGKMSCPRSPGSANGWTNTARVSRPVCGRPRR
jgi:hypothetical protein